MMNVDDGNDDEHNDYDGVGSNGGVDDDDWSCNECDDDD